MVLYCQGHSFISSASVLLEILIFVYFSLLSLFFESEVGIRVCSLDLKVIQDDECSAKSASGSLLSSGVV